MSTTRRIEKTEDKEITTFGLWKVWLHLFLMMDNSQSLTTITKIGDGFRCRVRRYERL